ncbi:MAG: ribokinase [Clostridiales bacterium]|jgi:ribokinase|nr:ribokinase [Clostridiales bacterium]
MYSERLSIVVIGSINVDLVIETPRVPLAGESLIGYSLEQFLGGKGSNQAISLKRLGGDVIFSGKTGNDAFGNYAVDNLREEGLDTSYIFTDNKSATGIAFIIVEPSGENRIIAIPGANGKYGIAETNSMEAVIHGSSLVLLQLEIPLHSIKRISNIAKENNIPVLIDAGPAQAAPLELFNGATIVSPNESEALALTNIMVNDISSAKNAARILLNSGARNVVMKLGANGALIANDSDFRHVPAYDIEPVDTTAAGDAFTAALALKYAQGASIDEAVSFANAAGALTALKKGARPSLPYKKDIEAFITEDHPRRTAWI